jgi:lipoate---protein ligase
MGDGFAVVERHLAPRDLIVADEPSGRLAVFCYPSAPAVVLGSTQPLATINESLVSSSGVDLVRRRSGGGAVFVAPGAQVWLDIFVPAGDPYFDVDVSKAAGFVGRLWRSSLIGLEGDEADLAVYDGPLVRSPWSRSWCYAGLGPGEVTLRGQKLVGLSQRRSRAGAWFFTMAYVGLDPSRDASFLSGSDEWRAGLAEELSRTQTSLVSGIADVASQLVASLALL